MSLPQRAARVPCSASADKSLRRTARSPRPPISHPDLLHSCARVTERQTSPCADAERRECRLTQFAADETELGAQREKRCEQSARRALWISRSSSLFARDRQRRCRPHKNPIYCALEL